MKTYEIELRRTSYITIWVDAESQDEAEQKAWEDVENNRADINDADWGIEYVKENG